MAGIYAMLILRKVFRFNPLSLYVHIFTVEMCESSFGGGPVVNRLSACKPCVQEAERLSIRQQREKQAFLEVYCCYQLLLIIVIVFTHY